jgi:hypothetical protein
VASFPFLPESSTLVSLLFLADETSALVSSPVLPSGIAAASSINLTQQLLQGGTRLKQDPTTTRP